MALNQHGDDFHWLNKMDWTKVNWFPEERTMDITPESMVPHHKPRWYISWNVVPIVLGILNHLLK